VRPLKPEREGRILKIYGLNLTPQEKNETLREFCGWGRPIEFVDALPPDLVDFEEETPHESEVDLCTLIG